MDEPIDLFADDASEQFRQRLASSNGHGDPGAVADVLDDHDALWNLHGREFHLFPQRAPDAKGDKKPDGRWRHGRVDYVEVQPTAEELAAWEARRPFGWLLLCGGPKRLVCLDFEPAGLADKGPKGDAIRAVINRLPETCRRPSVNGGQHCWTVVTDGPAPSGTGGQLVQRNDGDPHKPTLLAEYRGDGQYAAILGPGRGPLPASWAPAELTGAELDAIFEELRAVSDLRPVAERRKKPRPEGYSKPGEARDWTARPPVDTGDVLAHAICDGRLGWLDLLSDDWSEVGSLADGWSHWLRPDDADGTAPKSEDSAKGRELAGIASLTVHSSSVTWSTPSGSHSPGQVLARAGRLDLPEEFTLDSDFKLVDARFGPAMTLVEQAAARVIEDGEALEAGHPLAGWPRSVFAEVHELWMARQAKVRGGGLSNLPPEFWTARPMFGHIQQAAHSRGRSADATLGGVLARVALFTPPTLRLPAIVGATCGLDLYVASVGQSGGGKSSAYAIARELLPGTPRTDLVDGRPLGSGEGVAEAFYRMVSVPPASGKGRPTTEHKLVNTAALIYVDEGEAISQIGGRRGSTLLSELRAGWSGQTIGQGNASADTTRIVPAGKYRLVLVVNWQPELAASVLGNAVGGFPQRLVWFSALDASIPARRDRKPWPGTLAWRPPATITSGGLVTVAPEVAAEIADRDWRRSTGTLRCHPLDGHRDLSRLKVAALLGILDGRLDVNVEDWRLAGMILDTSDAVRAGAIDAGHAAETQEHDRRTAGYAKRAVVVDSSVDASRRDQALARMAKAVGRKLHRDAPKVVSRRDLTLATASADRQLASIDDAIEDAIAAGWAVEADGGWSAGSSRPA